MTTALAGMHASAIPMFARAVVTPDAECDAKMREVQKEGDEGAKMLQNAIEGLPGGTHGAERFKAQYDTFRDVSALASDMDSLATVQGCVALVADKMKIVEEVEATLRKEVAALKGELEPIEQVR